MSAGLNEKFASLSRDDTSDELQAACLVTQALDASVDIDTLSLQMRNLAAGCVVGIDPWNYLRQVGFSGNADDYSAVDNSRMDLVLQNRRGIPITLGVVLIHVGRELGYRTQGVNFPGNFLVRVDDALIDPFHMTQTSEEECLRENHNATADAFVAAPPRAIALRMLNNLKFNFAAIGSWDRALDILDYQLAMEPGSPGLYIERGDFWSRLDAIDMARQSYERAAELVAAADLASRSLVAGRLAALPGRNVPQHKLLSRNCLPGNFF